MKNRVSHIATFSGKVFDLVNPKPEMVCIEDIAHSLAFQCRYTGHTRFFYSVAQHCVLMADNPELPGDSMKKLLHDADETYIGDMAKPWKQLLAVDVSATRQVNQHYVSVGEFEHKIQDVIGLALGVDLSYSAGVKESDITMAATEVRDVMTDMRPDFKWGYDFITLVKEPIVSWTPQYAEQRFLDAYERIKI